MLMPVDAKTFIFKIIEPESNLMTSLSVSLEEALTEKQLATLNRKDLAKLKLLAKVILEEKSVIKRREDVENIE
jgi:hypothetical protein